MTNSIDFFTATFALVAVLVVFCLILALGAGLRGFFHKIWSSYDREKLGDRYDRRWGRR